MTSATYPGRCLRTLMSSSFAEEAQLACSPRLQRVEPCLHRTVCTAHFIYGHSIDEAKKTHPFQASPAAAHASLLKIMNERLWDMQYPSRSNELAMSSIRHSYRVRMHQNILRRSAGAPYDWQQTSCHVLRSVRSPATCTDMLHHRRRRTCSTIL